MLSMSMNEELKEKLANMVKNRGKFDKRGIMNKLVKSLITMAVGFALVPVDSLILNALVENHSSLLYILGNVLAVYIAPIAVFAYGVKQMFGSGNRE